MDNYNSVNRTDAQLTVQNYHNSNPATWRTLKTIFLVGLVATICMFGYILCASVAGPMVP